MAQTFSCVVTTCAGVDGDSEYAPPFDAWKDIDVHNDEVSRLFFFWQIDSSNREEEDVTAYEFLINFVNVLIEEHMVTHDEVGMLS